MSNRRSREFKGKRHPARSRNNHYINKKRSKPPVSGVKRWCRAFVRYGKWKYVVVGLIIGFAVGYII